MTILIAPSCKRGEQTTELQAEIEDGQYSPAKRGCLREKSGQLLRLHERLALVAAYLLAQETLSFHLE